MRRILALVVLMLTVGSGPVYAMLPLQGETVNAAVGFGRQNAGNPGIPDEWCLYDYVHDITVLFVTPFLDLAWTVKKHTERNLPVTAQDIQQWTMIINNNPNYRMRITVSGYTVNFANNIGVTLQQGNKVFNPSVRITLEPRSRMGGQPPYRAHLLVELPKKDIDPGKPLVLILRNATGKETETTLYLSQMR